GDLAHGCTPAEFKALDDATARLAMPAIAVPGNHDMADLGAFRKRFGTENAVYTLHNCDFICVNSEAIQPAVLGWLDRALVASEANRRTHVFVVIHHPPGAGDAVDKVLAKHRVTAVLAGHLHTTGQSNRGGYVTYWVSGSAKVRDKNGLRYNVFTVTAEGIKCEPVLVDAATQPAHGS
ncbi:MAG: metallophosphoesterase, partial [Phycisphaerae bacterium]|nr:metallophosphoesterase [Phycisphaerae bacterium]